MDAVRMPARTFQDLIVWRKGHEFVLGVYKFTAGFPRQETYGLCSQMRRAAVSIPANIAEGFQKRGRADKAPIHEHCRGVIGGMPVLSDSGAGSGLRKYGKAHGGTGRSKPASQRVHKGNSKR